MNQCCILIMGETVAIDPHMLIMGETVLFQPSKIYHLTMPKVNLAACICIFNISKEENHCLAA